MKTSSTAGVGQLCVWNAVDVGPWLRATHGDTRAPRRGETDGVLLRIPAAQTPLRWLGLSASQKAAAQAIIKGITCGAGDQFLATAYRGAARAHRHRYRRRDFNGMSGRYVASELYGFAQPHGKMRMIIAPPFADTFKPESDGQQQSGSR